MIRRALAGLGNAQVVLWCYFLWYASTVAHHFDPSPSLWLNSLGISLVIGLSLVLSVGGIRSALAQPRQTFRLFATPFCVSSFAALIKDRAFLLVLPPSPRELAVDLSLCAVFVLAVALARRGRSRTASTA